MRELYRELLAGSSATAALRAAKLEVRSRGLDSFGWGGFVCIDGLHPVRGLRKRRPWETARE